MPNTKKDNTHSIKVACTVLFAIFVVTYVFTFQCDVLAMIQYAWSDGQKHYDRIIGTVVLSGLSFVLLFVTTLLSRLPGRMFSFNFYPALLVLGLLTAVVQGGTSVHTSIPWLVAFIPLLVVCIVVMRTAGSNSSFMKPLRATNFLSQPWWTNLLILFFGFCMVFAMSNTDRTLHTRLAVERMCMDGDYAKALERGFPQYDNDSALTMLRALALAHTVDKDSVCQLGERLFEYEITGSSSSLFPRRDKSCCFLLGNGYMLWQTIGFVPYDQTESPVRILKRQLLRERQRLSVYTDTVIPQAKRDSLSKPLCSPRAADYLLCAYLLDRNLSEFVKELPRYYKADAKLPKHYKEACVLYSKLTGTKFYTDAALDADCMDFLSIMRANHSPILRNATLRDSYFGTYWYYYYK